MSKTVHLHLELTVADDCDPTSLAADLFEVLVDDEHNILPAAIESVDDLAAV